jgi:voltage-gated sodium channel
MSGSAVSSINVPDHPDEVVNTTEVTTGGPTSDKRAVAAWEEQKVEGGDMLEPLTPSKRKHSVPKQRTSVAVEHGFDSPQDILKNVEKAMKESEKAQSISVHDLYFKKGVAQRIAKSDIFENTTLAIIILNAIYIAIDTDWNRADKLADYDWPFFVAEQIFCVYFTGEILIRFAAFEKKTDCVKDWWFNFDSILVALMVTETWILYIILGETGGESPLGNTAMLRLLRLLRLTRLVRMLRSLPELMILIKGMVTAMKSVFYVGCLGTIIAYVFSIAFTQLSQGTPNIGDTFFPHVGHGMYSLLIYATFLDDLSDLMDGLRHDKWPLVFVAWVFIGLSSMTLMNMLVGVLCEVVDAVAKTEREDIEREEVSKKMRGIADEIDENKDGVISYREFEKIVENPVALAAMKEVGVSATGLLDFAELFFFDDQGKQVHLEFPAFMEMFMSLKDDNLATVKDVLNLWKNIKDSTAKDVIDMQDQLASMQVNMTEKIDKLDKNVKNLSLLTQKLKGQKLDRSSDLA